MGTSRTSRGFTLLYTIIVMALVVIISGSVYSLLSRELSIANVAKQSQLAYYAAEAALECAIFHAYDGKFTSGSPQPREFSCGEIDDNISVNTSTGSFTFDVAFAQTGTCATVNVNTATRQIEAKGYNTCENRRVKVERGIEVTY